MFDLNGNNAVKIYIFTKDLPRFGKTVYLLIDEYLLLKSSRTIPSKVKCFCLFKTKLCPADGDIIQELITLLKVNSFLRI